MHSPSCSLCWFCCPRSCSCCSSFSFYSSLCAAGPASHSHQAMAPSTSAERKSLKAQAASRASKSAGSRRSTIQHDAATRGQRTGSSLTHRRQYRPRLPFLSSCPSRKRVSRRGPLSQTTKPTRLATSKRAQRLPSWQTAKAWHLRKGEDARYRATCLCQRSTKSTTGRPRCSPSPSLPTWPSDSRPSLTHPSAFQAGASTRSASSLKMGSSATITPLPRSPTGLPTSKEMSLALDIARAPVPSSSLATARSSRTRTWDCTGTICSRPSDQMAPPRSTSTSGRLVSSFSRPM